MLHTFNIIFHVIAGITAILIAIIPYTSLKGGRTHKLFGRLFLALMAVVIVSAFNGVIFFRDRPFLTVVTMLATYTSYSGFRIIKTKDGPFELIDFLVMCIVLIVAGLFLYDMESANVLWNKSVVYYLLMYVICIVGFDILRYFVPNLIKVKNFWVYEHVYKITGSFTALISAGAGTVLSAYEPYNQIIPAVAGSFWLIFCLIYFPKRYINKMNKSK